MRCSLSSFFPFSEALLFPQILEGELHEVRYDASNPRKLRVKGITQLRDEAVAYIDDFQGVHKMVNPNQNEGSISLHIYIPAIQTCHLYKLDGTKTLINMTAANVWGSGNEFTEVQLQGAQLAPITSVADLVDKLNAAFEANPADGEPLRQAVATVMDRVHFVASEWTEHVHFSEFSYTRMLLTLHDRFSLVLICWNPNQSCPIHSHDHCPSNTMFVKTIVGSISYARYTDASGTQLRDLTALGTDTSTFVMANSEIGFHTSRNTSNHSVALSLHLYTPPLLECSHSEGVAPVVYCEKSSALKSASRPVLWLDGGVQAVQQATDSKLTASSSVFSNVQTLLDTLARLFAAPDVPDLSAKLSLVLEKFEFNPKEVEQYKASRGSGRRRVALHPDFEVFIIVWNAGQQTPIHDHGGSLSWIKVLEGELSDTYYCKPERGLAPYVIQSQTLHRGEVAFLDASMIHSTKALGEACCSLTIYAPPYDDYNCYCDKSGHATVVSQSQRGPSELLQ